MKITAKKDRDYQRAGRSGDVCRGMEFPGRKSEHPVLTEAVQLLKGHGESISGERNPFFLRLQRRNLHRMGAGQLLSSKIVHLLGGDRGVLCLIYLLLCALYIFQKKKSAGRNEAYRRRRCHSFRLYGGRVWSAASKRTVRERFRGGYPVYKA